MALLSKKKEKWAIQRRKALKGVLIGKPINKNKHADVYYRTAMEKEFLKFLDSLKKDLSESYAVLKINNAKHSPAEVRRVLKWYKTNKFKIYLQNSVKIVEKWLKLAAVEADKSASKRLFELAGKEISIQYDKSYDEALKLMIERNVQLITNTTTQILTNVENIVYDGMTTGEGWAQIERDLATQTKISQDRIKRIARDQTAKTNEALNQIEQRSAGFEFFEWDTAQDERVSTGYGGHKQLQGKIYRWGDEANYPVIDSYGHRGLPAQRPNCRCTALPVVILKGYRAKQLSDGSYEIVKAGGLFDEV